jgi:hypothetical protein
MGGAWRKRMGQYLTIAFFKVKFIMLLNSFHSFLKKGIHFLTKDLKQRDEDFSH